MKRIVSLLLAFVMCLSLCACGGEKTGEEESTNKVQLEFFAECPVLPTPTNYGNLYQASRSQSTFNGNVTAIKYGYSVSAGKSDDINEVYNTYIEKIQAEGIEVNKISEFAHEAFYESTKIATITISSTKINVDIEPGSANISGNSTGTENGNASNSDKVMKLGETVETSYASLVLEKYGQDSEIRSNTDEYGGYSYYSSDSGNPFFYLHGNFKNLGGKPVDIANVYVQFCFDGKYTYRGDICALEPGDSDFIRDISPLSSTEIYAYAEVPQELLNTAKSCVVRIGFTENFDYKVVDVNDLPVFKECDDVFALEIAF